MPSNDSVAPLSLNPETDRQERVIARIQQVLVRDCRPVFHGQAACEMAEKIVTAVELEYAR